jgi:hypothetical protein
MPVTTRSKSQKSAGLPSTPENANPHLPSKPPSKIVEDSSCTTAPSNPIQNPVTSKKPRRAQRALSSSPKPQKRSRKHQSSDKRVQSQAATELSSPDLPDSAITHWACSRCSCPQAAFDYPVDACICCGHEMDEHYERDHDWNPDCPNVCERKD